MSRIFSAFTLNSTHTLKNRLAVAPMTTQQSNAPTEASVRKKRHGCRGCPKTGTAW